MYPCWLPMSFSEVSFSSSDIIKVSKALLKVGKRLIGLNYFVLDLSFFPGFGIITNLDVFQHSGNVAVSKHLFIRSVIIVFSTGHDFLKMPAVMPSNPGTLDGFIAKLHF